MRTLTKLSVAAAVLLALAGCTNHQVPRVSALSAPSNTEDEIPAERLEGLGVVSDSVRFLAEKDGYAFYTALMDTPDPREMCLIMDNLAFGVYAAGCGRLEHTGPLGLEASGIKAKLIADGYDAKTALAKGWFQPHRNLLVHGL
jgi:hypothetical protein